MAKTAITILWLMGEIKAANRKNEKAQVMQCCAGELISQRFQHPGGVARLAAHLFVKDTLLLVADYNKI